GHDFRRLRPRRELTPASHQLVRARRRDAGESRSLADDPLIGPISSCLISQLQVFAPPPESALDRAGDPIPQCPGIDQRGQKIEHDRIEGTAGGGQGLFSPDPTLPCNMSSELIASGKSAPAFPPPKGCRGSAQPGYSAEQ